MITRILFMVLISVIFVFQTYGATVNVKPGDDIEGALQEAGPGGTVIFAPGEYHVVAFETGERSPFDIDDDLAGITLQGAGVGFDPETATIINGEANFIESGLDIQASDVTVEGFTFYQIWDEGSAIQENVFNVEIRNCWFIACESGMEDNADSGTGAGIIDENESVYNQPDAIRFINCVFARGGDDGTDIEEDNQYIFINCDFYDWNSDMVENEDNSLVIFRNCIFHAGVRSDDIDAGGNSIIELQFCVLFDPSDGPVDTGIDFDGGVIPIDPLFVDPLYVNVGPAVPDRELDFHLRADSPALTAGFDENDNPTFAGAMGAAQ